MISVLSAIPSQWALQYFCFSGARQLQAGFAHFLGLGILMTPQYPDSRIPGVWMQGY
jgi:hypothetical protein